jgi:hypothetical protein
MEGKFFWEKNLTGKFVAQRSPTTKRIWSFVKAGFTQDTLVGD